MEQLNKYEILKQNFGHEKFRDFQEKAIEAVLEKRDLLTILPTGGGKSLCYQLPSLMMSGVSIVISPLIALMQDQVVSLKVQGIKAAMISSMQTNEELSLIYQELKQNRIKLLYIAPERLSSESFFEFLQTIDINFFVIDEAHCVSEWGHEFRGDYRRLGKLKDIFINTPIIAFTATATLKVQDDIISELKLQNPLILRAKVNRENLFIKTLKRVSNGRNQLINFLNLHKDECGIVYTFTRKESVELAKFLQSKNFSAKAYHAGLSNEIRDSVYKDFIYDKIDIVVATVAFGMGIDKSNIRFVVHTSLPKTIENYYQEIGRAGRDGLKSSTLLLYSKADQIQKSQMITNTTSEYKQILLNKLEQMYILANSSKCRHKVIAKYFDDDINECKNLCDNCLKDDVKQIDITIEAQKFLSAVYKSGQTFGVNHIIDILRGSNSKKILQFSHDKLSVYAIGKDISKTKWEAIVDRLFEIESITRSNHSGIVLTKVGFEILKKRLKVQIDEDKQGVIEKTTIQKENIFESNEVFQSLKELRMKLSLKESVPAFVIFSDKTLIELSDKLPQTKDEMLSINGIGEVKFERYGEEFLNILHNFKDLKATKIQKLTKTHLETLELINQNLNIQEIAKIKDIKLNTVLNYINLLNTHQKIDDQTKDKLFEPIIKEFPQEIKEWIDEGVKLKEFTSLKEYFTQYGILFT